MKLEGARILLSGVVLGQPMGGVRRHNAELLPRVARRLLERDAELTVLEGLEPIAIELPDEVRRVRRELPAGPPLVRALAEGRAVRSLLEEARTSGTPYSLFHTAHLPVPRKLEVPLTFTIHDLRRLDPVQSPRIHRMVARFALRRALKSAARVLCVTQAVRDELVSQLGVSPASIRLVPNAADHFEPLPRAPLANAPLLCVGHLEPRKNLELVLRALALDSGLPALQLAGAAKGDEAERLARLARELGVTERVEFLGPLAEIELPLRLSRAACVVLPSRIEGFGIGALEAQRAGVPLAIADIPALREVAGPKAPRFAPDDAAACASAIRTALASSPEALEAARKNSERYSWDASAAAWVAAWEELSSSD